uniref:Uncharacterized protein n=1 Tax=Serinus canaria TaxID=9135 RepID=A0A8C9KWF6_SERCA
MVVTLGYWDIRGVSGIEATSVYPSLTPQCPHPCPKCPGVLSIYQPPQCPHPCPQTPQCPSPHPRHPSGPIPDPMVSQSLSQTATCPCPHPSHPSVPTPVPEVSPLSPCVPVPQALDKISAYMRSGHFMKTPIFWRTAKWGNTKE